VWECVKELLVIFNEEDTDAAHVVLYHVWQKTRFWLETSYWLYQAYTSIFNQSISFISSNTAIKTKRTTHTRQTGTNRWTTEIERDREQLQMVNSYRSQNVNWYFGNVLYETKKTVSTDLPWRAALRVRQRTCTASERPSCPWWWVLGSPGPTHEQGTAV